MYSNGQAISGTELSATCPTETVDPFDLLTHFHCAIHQGSRQQLSWLYCISYILMSVPAVCDVLAVSNQTYRTRLAYLLSVQQTSHIL